MDSRDLSDEQLERISARLADRIRRRRRLGQTAALVLAGAAGVILGAAVLTAVTTDQGAPVAAPVTCWKQDGQNITLSGEIQTSTEQSTASLTAACAALAITDGRGSDGNDAAQFSAIASQVCRTDERILIFTDVTETIDCTDPPTSPTGDTQ